MISELSKSIKAALYERVVSPLSGMFLLSWIAWNWKLCLVLIFAEYGVDKKISTISTNYVNTYDNVLYPLVSTVVLVFLYPLAAILPVRLWEWSNSYKLKMKHWYSLQVPISLEQSISLKQEIQNEKQKLQEIMEENRLREKQREALESELTSRLASAQKEIERLQKLMSEHEGMDKQTSEDEFSAAYSIASQLNLITERIKHLKPGEKTTLKSLLPQSEWVKVPETQRKLMGKDFKQMVDRGDFIGLSAVPEKTSSNEQVYIRAI